MTPHVDDSQRLARLASRAEDATPHGARRALFGILATCSALALAGCASSSSYAVLEREAQAADAVPADLPARAAGGADFDSARAVGEHEGASLWIMRGEDPGSVCLLSYRDDEAWVVGCGGESGLVTSGEAGHFVVVADGMPAPDGAVQISENVYGY
ncbi:hypothetical protein [Microbacterium sp. Marseille-Q6965]|uniref:hypothetical protein n=1 Tax=Microbacterium sp. Marseille-Q6965 TaxID=2965072 RepID=UPI0021B8143A|nr:hypothetical protein [Microbacterium sp. Marseille-Q6965]